MKEYTINRDGRNYGPYPEADIRTMLASGEVKPTDQAWHPGATGWAPLGQLLGDTPGAPPPKPKKSTAKKILLGCGIAFAVVVIGGIALFAIGGFYVYKHAKPAFNEALMQTSAKQVSAAWLQKSTDARSEEVTIAEIKTVVPILMTDVKMSVEPHDTPGVFVPIDYAGTSTDTLKIRKGDRLLLERPGYERAKSVNPGAKTQTTPPADGLLFDLDTGDVSKK